ncbi:SBBP repeat-containing protein [Flavobacteriales bacterium]|nr:SBBP repeat-containing protein [Flavobacteriales bacterium]
MKTYILTFLFLSATFILNAQQFEWAKSMGGTSSDRAYSITTDASGNVYTAGSFKGTVDFDPFRNIMILFIFKKNRFTIFEKIH